MWLSILDLEREREGGREGGRCGKGPFFYLFHHIAWCVPVFIFHIVSFFFQRPPHMKLPCQTIDSVKVTAQTRTNKAEALTTPTREHLRITFPVPRDGTQVYSTVQEPPHTLECAPTIPCCSHTTHSRNSLPSGVQISPSYSPHNAHNHSHHHGKGKQREGDLQVCCRSSNVPSYVADIVHSHYMNVALRNCRLRDVTLSNVWKDNTISPATQHHLSGNTSH